MALATTARSGDDERTAPPEARPPIPLGRRIELPGRGTTFVREVEGPPGAPTLLLLHGWMASGGLNWYRCFDVLAEHFNVIAPDLRGHGRGVRAPRIFRLADCADDCAATLEALDVGPVIAVGYSMGGPVSQLLWRRHRDLVAGLVECATAARFIPSPRDRLVFQSAMFAAVSATRFGVRIPHVPGIPLALAPWRPSTMSGWASVEFRRHDMRMMIEAGHSLSTYDARRWLGEVDVPTAVLLTTNDGAVQPDLQLELVDGIPGARAFTVADHHLACAHDSFATPLLDACLDVAQRATSQGLLPAH